ncbi:MAG: hypothetical protein KTR24_17155, partial [Saprospiraceae bacterium]|nr:hypothetical protein [Saprospiraceae bacterium]
MKFLTAIVLAFVLITSVEAQDGAWAETKDGTTHQLLISNGAFSLTSYQANGGAFNSTLGGLIKEEEGNAVFLIEFCSNDTSKIGFPQEWPFARKDDGGVSITVDGMEMAMTSIGENP